MSVTLQAQAEAEDWIWWAGAIRDAFDRKVLLWTLAAELGDYDHAPQRADDRTVLGSSSDIWDRTP